MSKKNVGHKEQHDKDATINYHTTRNKFLYVLFLLAVGFSSIGLADWYYSSKINERVEKKQHMLQIREDARIELNSSGKMRYIQQLERMESDVDRYASEFMEFIRKNKKTINYFAENDDEQHGYIEREGAEFRIVHEKYQKEQIARYLEELSNGNLAHANEIIMQYLVDPTFYREVKDRQTLETMLLIMKTYQKYNNSEEKESVTYMEIRSADRTFHMTKEQLKKEYSKIKEYFSYKKEDMKNISLLQFGADFILNKKMFSWFHTHPKHDYKRKDCKYRPGPSTRDKAVTYQMGPDILFSYQQIPSVSNRSVAE